MSCLIYAVDGMGNCIGKCDSNCYEAKHPECDCICMGMNHGKGLKIAQENITKHAEEWMRQYRKFHPEVKSFGFGEDPNQLKLF